MENTRAAAKAAGEKTYVGGPCKHGHTLRLVVNKTCVECDYERKRAAYQTIHPPQPKSPKRVRAPRSPSARELAKAAGKKFYIGAPCAHGHSGQRYVSNKLCVECGRAAAMEQHEAGDDRHNEARRENAFMAEFYPEEFDRQGWRRGATMEWDTSDDYEWQPSKWKSKRGQRKRFV